MYDYFFNFWIFGYGFIVFCISCIVLYGIWIDKKEDMTLTKWHLTAFALWIIGAFLILVFK